MAVPEEGELPARRAALDHALPAVQARAEAVGGVDPRAGADFGMRRVLELDHIRVAEEGVAERAEQHQAIDALVEPRFQRLVDRAGAEATILVPGRQLELRGEVEAEARARLVERRVSRGERGVADPGFGGLAALGAVVAADAGDHVPRPGDAQPGDGELQLPGVAVVSGHERDREDLRFRPGAVIALAVVDAGAGAQLAVGGERRRGEEKRRQNRKRPHQCGPRPERSGRSGRSGFSGRSPRSRRSARACCSALSACSLRSAFSERIRSPTLKPRSCAITPQPLWSARSCRILVSSALICAGVGLVTPCFFRSASASASAILMLPLPILPVDGMNVVVVLPSVSVTSLPSRSPSTSDFEFASEPAKSEYSFTSWSRFSARAASARPSMARSRMVLVMAPPSKRKMLEDSCCMPTAS